MPQALHRLLDRMGRKAASVAEEIGFATALLGECLYWLVLGRRRGHPLRLASVVAQAMDIGISALPIVTILSATIGLMLAIQGIYTLRIFGAESRVTLGLAFSCVREFSPLVTGILVAGRSGSALAARLGSMRINQELDALTVMGIAPVRFLVLPALVAMAILMPLLTLWADLVSLTAAGLYVSADLETSLSAYADDIVALLHVHDLMHGLAKSAIFAVLIALIGVINGINVTGGAEGVGRMTTRAVVQAIAAILVTDMAFAFLVTR